MADGEVKLFFEFDLPKLPADVNIDYAVLSFGVNVTALPEEAVANVLEILSPEAIGASKSVDYNGNPLTNDRIVPAPEFKRPGVRVFYTEPVTK